MKVAISADHRGAELKSKIVEYLRINNFNVLDLGANTSDPSDYPQTALKVALAVKNNTADYGIVICGTGIGVSIACNKVPGIRAALVHNTNEALLARQHNDANVLALSATSDDVLEISHIFLSTQADNDERLIRRRNQVMKIEQGAYDEL